MGTDSSRHGEGLSLSEEGPRSVLLVVLVDAVPRKPHAKRRVNLD